MNPTLDSIKKYEEWVVELDRRRLGLVASRRQLRWLLVVCAVASAITLHWGAFAALCMAGFWLTLFGTGLYIASMYDWDYIGQIEAARREIEALRAAAPDGSSPEDDAPAPKLPDVFQGRRVARKLTWGFRDRIE